MSEIRDPDNTSETNGGKKCVGRYVLEETIALRRNSTVFRALDPNLERDVALKLYHRRSTDTDENAKRVLNEGRALSRIDSPYVARCHSLEEIDGSLVLVNEWIEGASLDVAMQSNPMTYNQVLKVFTEICEGAASIHESGIIHRDIKPSNIIINQQGVPRIIDLGLAESESSRPSSEFRGTISYLAPEIFAGNVATEATDIFGLGGVLYYMLTGRAIYEGESPDSVLKLGHSCQITPSHEVDERSAHKLDSIAEMCLNERPEDRYSSVAELLSCLRSIRSNSRLLPTIGGVLLALLVGVGGWFSLRGGTDVGSVFQTEEDVSGLRRTLEQQADTQIVAGQFHEAAGLLSEHVDQLETDHPASCHEAQISRADILHCHVAEGNFDQAKSIAQSNIQAIHQHARQHPCLPHHDWRKQAEVQLAEVNRISELTIDLRRRVCDNVGRVITLQRKLKTCLLYTSPSPRDKRQSRMPSSA